MPLIRGILFGLALLLPLTGLYAQLSPEDAVRNFRLPRYGEDGSLIWLLEGRQGLFVSEREVDVVGMTLRVFEAATQLVLKTRIEATQATLMIGENRAFGEDWIEVEGSHFTLRGQVWTWNGEAEEVIVQKNVEVRFDGNFLNVLE